MSITAAIVQARYASTRLPGKVLMELRGMPVLAHVLARCRAVEGVTTVVCATTAGRDTDAIADLAKACGALVFRGSEDDVLGRYVGAARLVEAETILRVTSDCPLIDPQVCAEVLALRAAAGADYACNNMPPTWPYGLDCEAFTRAALEQADAQARSAEEREHVTPWLRRHPALRRANLPASRPGLSVHRWAIDLPEYYEFFQALFDRLPPSPALPNWAHIMEVVERDPEIGRLSAARQP
jgi:spore coat polysaccharide biosynthesis protein SpsF